MRSAAPNAALTVALASCATAVALLFAACTSTPRREAALAPLAIVPVDVRHGLPTVTVSVSGRPLTLFLDLGGHQGISLTAAELAQAKVRFLAEPSKFQDARGEVHEARRFVAADVSIGSLALGDMEGGEAIYGDHAPPDRNGSIGWPILGRYLLVLDYPSGSVRVYGSGDSAALEAECGARTFAIHFANGVARSVAATEFGDLEFAWDTGATSNFLRPSANAKLESLGRKLDDGPPVITLSKVVLGDHDVGPQEFRLFPFAAPAVDGYLGAGLMSSHRVCLDIGRDAARSIQGNERLQELAHGRRSRRRAPLLRFDPELHGLEQLGHSPASGGSLLVEVAVVPSTQVEGTERGEPSRSVGKEARELVDELAGLGGVALVGGELEGVRRDVILEDFLGWPARFGQRVELVRRERREEVSRDIDNLIGMSGDVQPVLPGRGSHVRGKQRARLNGVDRHRVCCARVAGV